MECVCCVAHDFRKVPPDGKVSAKLACIGEGPGFWETQRERAFYGRSGKIYERALQAIAFTRAEVWTSNAAMCMPDKIPEKKLSKLAVKKATAKQCRSRLIRELRRVHPKVILALGSLALESLTGYPSVQKRHGALHVVNLERMQGDYKPGDFAESQLTYVIPHFHPAYMLRGNPGYFPGLVQKLLHAKYLIDGGSPTVWREVHVTPYGLDVEENVRKLEELTQYILDKNCPICIDFEADSEKAKKASATVFGFGCLELNVGVSVSILQWNPLTKRYAHCWPVDLWERVERCIKLLQESDVAKWFHNFIYDVVMGRRYFHLNGKIGDTLALDYVYQSDILHNLGMVTGRELLAPAWKDDLKVREKKHGVSDLDLNSYNCKDTILDLHAISGLIERINGRGVAHLVEKQLQRSELARRAALHGLPVSKAIYKEIEHDWRDARDTRLRNMIDAIKDENAEQALNDFVAGLAKNPKKHKWISADKFNPRASRQGRWFLYEFLKLRCLYLTEGGTDKDEEKKVPSHSYKAVLDYLNVPLVKDYVEYFEFGHVITGVLATYRRNFDYDALMRSLWLLVDWSAGNQKGPRFTSFPNVQNIEKKIRRIFVAPTGYVWVGVDLSQVEYRIAACFAAIPELLHLFNDIYFDEHKEPWKKLDPAYDGHSLVATIVFSNAFTDAPTEIKEAFRTLVKRVVFALFYGALPDKIYHTLRRDRRISASVRAVLTKERIEKIHAGFSKRFQEWDTWADSEESFIKANGFQIFPPLNRKNFVPLADVAGILKPTELRNVPIQRAAGDIVADMMWAVEQVIDKEDLDARFSIHLHDAAYWLTRADQADHLITVVNDKFDITLRNYNDVPVHIFGQASKGPSVKSVG